MIKLEWEAPDDNGVREAKRLKRGCIFPRCRIRRMSETLYVWEIVAGGTRVTSHYPIRITEHIRDVVGESRTLREAKRRCSLVVNAIWGAA